MAPKNFSPLIFFHINFLSVVICSECFKNNARYSPRDDIPKAGRSSEPNPEACQQRCLDTVGCGFFSFWHGNNGKKGGCHLSSSNAKIEDYSGSWYGITAGPRECPNDTEGTFYNIPKEAIDFHLF